MLLHRQNTVTQGQGCIVHYRSLSIQLYLFNCTLTLTLKSSAHLLSSAVICWAYEEQAGGIQASLND